MGQKYIFNQLDVLGENPFVGLQTDAVAKTLHQLGLEGTRTEELWALHLWAATNDAPAGGATPILSVGAIDRENGGAIAIAARQFNGIADADANKVVKICDGLPLRGQLDIQAVLAAGAANSTMVVWGYLQRGATRSDVQRRFLDGSAVGNQQTDFTGGQLITIGLGATVDIQETDESYIDEVTLDFTPGPDANAHLALVCTGSPVQPAFDITQPQFADPVRIFDGQPLRNVGTLRGTNVDAEGTPFLTGWFFRS